MIDWCCIAAVNNETVWADNLAASPMNQARPDRLCPQRGFASASLAYNDGLAKTSARIVILAHQDVYIPDGWDALLNARIAELDAIDPNWGVAASFGISRAGAYCGRVWTTGLGREVGTSPVTPIPAQSFDELLLILNRDAGLQFDPLLPSFHLYGTDIAQTAIEAGHGAYIIDAPVVHNSRPVVTLSGGFEDALIYMRRKWRQRLPIMTPVTHITQLGLRYLLQRIRMRDWPIPNTSQARAEASTRSPREIAHELGYE